MKSKKILSFNLILSFFGIYLTYFYFGAHVYFHNSYDLFEIFRSTIIISLIFSFPIILTIFVINKAPENIFKRIIISSILSFLIYVLFHYIVRFSDINYNYIYSSFFDNKNYLLKIIFYCFPFIITFIAAFFLSAKQIFKINKFVLILLIMLNILSINRILEIYQEKNNTTSDFKNFKRHPNDGQTINKKVFFLIFDEFDQNIFKKNFQKFNYINELYNSSYVNKNFYSPAKFTLDSIPAILVGSATKKTIFKGAELYIENLNNELIHFNHVNSLFNLKNISSSIYGFYHPYCRVLKIENCYDRFNFKKNKINLNTGINNFLAITHLHKLIGTITLFSRGINSDEIGERINISKFMIENSLEFLKSNTNIIFIHYPFPHPPFKEGIIHIKDEYQGLSDYEKNLFLVDETFSKIKEYIYKQEDSLLIVTSDHWHKDSGENEPLPMVFFSKIIGDNSYYEESEKKNATNIKQLINDFFDNNITNNSDINNFFKVRKNHKTYVR